MKQLFIVRSCPISLNFTTNHTNQHEKRQDMCKKFVIFVWFVVVFFFLDIASLNAQTTMFVGAGLEGNANTREGAAMGASVASAVDLKWFSAGVKLGFSANMDTVNTLETAALFRYNLPLPIKGFFVQAELGSSFFFEKGGNYPAFLGGLVAGWRYNTGKHWYIEPFARGGYPFVWGIGLQTGASFDLTGGEK